MIDDMTLLAGICLGLALWVIRLQYKLARAEKFAFMAAMALHDVADNTVHITRAADGTITLKKVKP